MTVISIFDMNNGHQPNTAEGLKVGAVVQYENRGTHDKGIIFEVGNMINIAWTDTPGTTQVAHSQIEPVGGNRYGFRLTGEMRTAEEALAARDIAMRAKEQRKQNNERALEDRETTGRSRDQARTGQNIAG